MNIYLTLDLEGVTGVTALEQVRHGSPEFPETRRRLTREINAALEGALQAGAAAFLVNEGHGQHRNVIPEDLHEAAKLLSGRNKLLHYMHGIDGGYAGMFMIGYHAGPGVRRGILGHTFHAYRCLVNGRDFTEVGLGMALAGHYGVPTLLVTGDEETCRYAQTLVPEVEVAVVKQGVSANAAVHLHPRIAEQAIRAAAGRAIERATDIPPFTVAGPFNLQLHLYSPLMADLHEYLPTCRRTGDRSVELNAPDFEQLFKLFLLSSTLSMTAHGLGVMN